MDINFLFGMIKKRIVKLVLLRIFFKSIKRLIVVKYYVIFMYKYIEVSKGKVRLKEFLKYLYFWIV